jgi:soluble lytic murein transglycosylase-like protein
MNLIDLLQMTKPQAAQQQSEGLGPIMQFLAQNKAPEMPAIQMPQTHDYGAQIMAHGLQKQDREDTYAAHLQAKNDMEQLQAQSIVGHEAELSDDPQVQAMLKSGNPQLVTYAMKIAEDEKQKKIAAQYNENPTFTRYQQALKENPALAEQMMQWIKAKGTNINLGENRPIMSSDAINMRNSDGTPARIQVGETPADLKGRGIYYDARPSEDMGRTTMNVGAVLNSISDLAKMDTSQYQPGMTKDFLGSQLKNAKLPFSNDKIPFISDIGNSIMSPERQSFESANEQMIQNIIHLLTGAGVSESEAERKTRAYAFSWGDADMTKAQKTKALNALVQSAIPRTGYNQDITKAVNPSSGVNKYDAIINAAAAKHGVDPDLLRAQMQQESAGNPTAVSPKGAAGLMQLMPGTAKQLGVTNVNDPIQNIEGGTRYLSEQISKYGNIPEALAAYNAGPNAVDKYNGIPPYRETQDYVKTIIDNYAGSKADIAKQQRDYNAGLKERALNAASKNSPAEKAKKEARIKELRKQAGLS